MARGVNGGLVSGGPGPMNCGDHATSSVANIWGKLVLSAREWDHGVFGAKDEETIQVRTKDPVKKVELRGDLIE